MVKAKAKSEVVRPIKFPEEQAIVCKAANGNALTVAQAKEFLGWEEEVPQTDSNPGTDFGENYLFKYGNGTKVRCWNNVKNRELTWSQVEMLTQEILNKRWRLNMEPLIIGKTGQTLNCQHRLIALVVAEWERLHGMQSHIWQDNHPNEITLDVLLAVGCDEDDAVVNTMDTARPRDLKDVIGRSEYFAALKKGPRLKASRLADYAIRKLWDRTMAKNAITRFRTHAESLDFLARHKTILKVVRWVMDKDGEGALSRILSPGYASAVIYMMAASKTDPATYQHAQVRDERKIDLGLMEKAKEFWELLLASDPAVKAVLEARRPGSEGEYAGYYLTRGEGAGSLAERFAVLAKGWTAFLDKGRVTPGDVALNYKMTEGGDMILADQNVTFGGVDLWEPEKEDDDTGPADLEARKEALRQQQRDELDQQRVDANPVSTSLSLEEQLEALHDLHDGYMLAFKHKAGYSLYQQDAVDAAKLLGLTLSLAGPKVQKTLIRLSDFDTALAKLTEAGFKVAIATAKDDVVVVNRNPGGNSEEASEETEAAPTAEPEAEAPAPTPAPKKPKPQPRKKATAK